MTTTVAEVPATTDRAFGRGLSRRAHLLSLFEHFATLNANHVALCLGCGERVAGVMLAQLAKTGTLTRVEYKLHREDRARVAYQMRPESRQFDREGGAQAKAQEIPADVHAATPEGCDAPAAMVAQA